MLIRRERRSIGAGRAERAGALGVVSPVAEIACDTGISVVEAEVGLNLNCLDCSVYGLEARLCPLTATLVDQMDTGREYRDAIKSTITQSKRCE